MKTLLTVALASAAGLATANPFVSQAQSGTAPTNVVNLLDYATVTTGMRDSFQTVDVTFDNDIEFTAGFPNATHAYVLDFSGLFGFSGESAYITAVGWDTTHTAYSPSWLADLRFEMTDLDALTGIGLSPSATSGPGGPENNSSGGLVDLIGLGLDFTLTDGMMLLTVWDTFDDFLGGAEGTLFAGSTLSFQAKVVPTPGAIAVLGLGGLVAGRRRR